MMLAVGRGGEKRIIVMCNDDDARKIDEVSRLTRLIAHTLSERDRISLFSQQH